MLGLESWALLACWTLAPSGRACDSVRNQAGNSTWNCFSLQQTVPSGRLPGKQNPWEKGWEHSATQRGWRQGRSRALLLCLPADRRGKALPGTTATRHTTEKRETTVWSALFRKQPQWMFSGNKIAFIYICSLCSRFLGNDSKVCKLRRIIFAHAELKNQQNIFKQTNKQTGLNLI